MYTNKYIVKFVMRGRIGAEWSHWVKGERGFDELENAIHYCSELIEKENKQEQYKNVSVYERKIVDTLIEFVI